MICECWTRVRWVDYFVDEGWCVFVAVFDVGWGLDDGGLDVFP